MAKTLRLPVELDDAEKLVVSKDLSAAITALEAAEAKKKLEMKSHNEAIRELKTSIHTLNVSLSTGTVEREIEVKEVEIPEDGIIQTIRLDTDAVVSSRSMDPEERQLKIGGADLDAINARIQALNTTEEQTLADDPQHAEELRDNRLAEEKATNAFETVSIGEIVDVKIGEDWTPVRVENKTEFHFEANNKLYDTSKLGISWRLPLTWDEVKAASQAAQDQAEIARLAGDQAKDDASTPKPKRLLNSKAAKAAAEAKRIKVQDEDGNPLPPPGEMCAPACEADHQHTEQRTAF